MSHHFDSPTALADGRINLCDLYVFPAAPGTSALILTVITSLLSSLGYPEAVRQILFGAIIVAVAAAYTRVTQES